MMKSDIRDLNREKFTPVHVAALVPFKETMLNSMADAIEAPTQLPMVKKA